MKKLMLCAVAVLCVAASIFGGYYFYVTNALQETAVQQDRLREEEEGNGATDAGMAVKYRSGAWREEDGSINPHGVANAIAQRDLYLAQQMPPDGFGDKGVARGVPSNWQPRGPENLGGRTEAILVHPLNPKIVWAGGASGGVWISYDSGEKWNATNTGLDNYQVSCLALDPGDPKGNTLYAGTGAHDLDGDGIFRSTNGGLDWEPIHGHAEGWKYVSSISVARINGNTVILAAVDNDLDDEGVERGIMRGTLFPNPADDSWEKVQDGTQGIAVGFDPNDSNKAVASVCYNEFYTVASLRNKCKAFYSINQGQSWSPSTLEKLSSQSGVPVIGPFESPRSGDSIHFAFQKPAPGSGPTAIYAQYGEAQVSVISKSTNGGAFFNTAGMEGNPQGINRGVPAFWVSPALAPGAVPYDPTLIITGGAFLFRSTNWIFEQNPIGGTAVPLHDPFYPHVDMQTIVNDPLGGTNRSIFLGTDGGIFHTDDVAAVTGAGPSSTPSGWSVRNTKLQNTQYVTISGDASSGIIVGGAWDNGTLRLVGRSTATRVLIDGDGGIAAVDGTDCYGQGTPRIIYRIPNCNDPGPYLWEVASAVNLPEEYNGLAGIPPMSFIIDRQPNDPERAFLALKGVWRTRDVKTGCPGCLNYPTWTAIKPNPAVTPSPGGTAASRPKVTSMALAPSDSNYMWVGENFPEQILAGSYLYRTDNALAASPSPMPTWTREDRIGSTDLLPNREITEIFVDPTNSPNQPDETVYVAFGGFADDNLWRGTYSNGHYEWQDITGGTSTCLPTGSMIGLPCAPIRAIAQHPDQASILFVGTEIGIYVTTNANSSSPSWRPVMAGPANVSIDDLKMMKNAPVLLAGTWGRGVWSLTFPTPGVPPTPDETPKSVNDFDGDGRSDLAVVREDSAHKDWHIQGSTESYRSQEFGNRDDQVAAADYDGDGKTDVAVYRGGEQKFYCLRSSDNTLAVTQINAQNAATAQTAVGDFDGDDLADEAVFDAYTGHWTVEQSSEGHLEFYWGEPNDNPVAADFNDDGEADFGVYHEANGMITLSYNANGEEFQKQFGLEGDVPVPGEYDGDKVIDLAVWRADDDGEGNGCWYITYGANGYEGIDAIPWGVSGDVPVPGDYDGDGKLDIAVFRPSTGMWHMLQSSNGYYSELFGASGDKPVGVKAVYASRGAGNGTFTKAPDWAEPKRRVEKPRGSNKETQMAD